MRQTLIGWAATSSFLILAVIALRAALGRRMGAGLRYALWGLVLVRLLVPVQLFSSPVMGTVIGQERFVTREIETQRELLHDLGGQDGPQAAVPALPSPPELPAAPDPPDWRLIPAALGWVWLAGAAVMAAVLLGCNLRFWTRLRRTRAALQGALPAPTIQEGKGVHLSGLPAYVAQGLPSPCLFGVFRPSIYVAPDTASDPAALRHVLAHEYTHFRHGDHIWSLLRCAALCVHWWNPLAWLAAKLSRRDGELACDQGVLKRLGDGERTAYGNTLLALVTAKSVPGGPLSCSTAMTGDKKSLTERIARIAKAPQRAAGIAAAAVILAALVMVCAFGQKTQASWAEMEAELSLSMERDGTVRLTGTVDGTRLARQGALWYSGDRYSFSGSHDGELSMIYPAFTDGIEGQLMAWWADEAHTAVHLSTYMMAALSSYFPSCYWEFTVDFSGGEGALTRMERGSARDLPDGTVVRMYPKTISDGEAIRAGRLAARLLAEAEAYYRGREAKEGVLADPEEIVQPPAPSEVPTPAPARAALRAALLGETGFTFYDGEGRPTAADIDAAPRMAFDISEEYGKIWYFCVVDLDGDGSGEAVLHVGDVAADMGGYLVLRWAGPGEVRCYPSYWRNFWDLKTDGTFRYDYYTGTGGFARVSFPAPGDTMEQQSIAEAYYPDIDPDAGGGTFTVNGETATQEEYDAAVEAQNAKPDAAWYEFTPENVEKVLG